MISRLALIAVACVTQASASRVHVHVVNPDGVSLPFRIISLVDASGRAVPRYLIKDPSQVQLSPGRYSGALVVTSQTQHFPRLRCSFEVSRERSASVVVVARQEDEFLDTAPVAPLTIVFRGPSDGGDGPLPAWARLVPYSHAGPPHVSAVVAGNRVVFHNVAPGKFTLVLFGREGRVMGRAAVDHSAGTDHIRVALQRGEVK